MLLLCVPEKECVLSCELLLSTVLYSRLYLSLSLSLSPISISSTAFRCVSSVYIYVKSNHQIMSNQKKQKLLLQTNSKQKSRKMAEHEFSNKSSLIRRGGICIFVDEEEAESIEQRPRGITFAPVSSPLPKCPLCGADISTTTTTANAIAGTTTATETTKASASASASSSPSASRKRSSHASAPDLGQGSRSRSARFWHNRRAAVTACWQQSKNRKRRFETGCSHCGATGESCRIPSFLSLSLSCSL